MVAKPVYDEAALIANWRQDGEPRLMHLAAQLDAIRLGRLSDLAHVGELILHDGKFLTAAQIGGRRARDRMLHKTHNRRL